MKKLFKILASCTVAGLVFASILAPTTREGQVRGKIVRATTTATLNGTSTITGTPFSTLHHRGDFAVFYQAAQGTSTPHYRIEAYGSPNNSTWTTEAIATITPSTDETSTDFKHRSLDIPVTPWVRVDIIGVTANATNTTFDMWIVEQ